MTPIHKKGDKQDPDNYRPVSVLSTVSKILENIIREQIISHCTEHNLIPKSQHGFLPGKSTTTSTINMCDKWLEEKNLGKSTGILLFDLSAAFDTISKDILLQKLKSLYFEEAAVAWIESYMSDRGQQIKIGNNLSSRLELTSGVPQGSILGPLLFVLYAYDLEKWIDQEVHLNTYADDTVISYSSSNVQKIKKKLEQEATKILQFCASNGLVANASKTKFLLIRGKGCKDGEENGHSSIIVDSCAVTESSCEKVLGIYINNRLDWSDHIEYLKNTMRQRTAIVKRLTYHLPRNVVITLLDGLVFSKVRYCLPLFASPRLTEEEPKNGDFGALQILVNNVLRIVTASKKNDQISKEELHKRCKAQSLNRMAVNATYKLTKKIIDGECNGLPDFYAKNIPLKEGTRTKSSGKLMPSIMQRGFRHNSIKIWNKFGNSDQTSLSEATLLQIPL